MNTENEVKISAQARKVFVELGRAGGRAGDPKKKSASAKARWANARKAKPAGK